jgi:pimeloyl-ACP methyl ester carboxylesterase
MVARKTTGLIGATALALAGLTCSGQQEAPRIGESSVLSSDGNSIAYEVMGEGEITLVFVHGWSCDRTYWKEQIGAFSEDFRVVTLDLAGHGESGANRTEWSIQRFGTDVVAVAEELDLRQIVLIGHSMGGPVALEAGLLLRDRLKGLVGIDTFFDFWGTPASPGLLEGLTEDFPEFTRGFVEGSMFTPASEKDLVEEVASDMAAAPPEVAIPSMVGLLNWAAERAPESVPDLEVPIGLIMTSGGDQGTINFQELREEEPMVGIKEMEEVGHFLMLEAPGPFNSILRQMLSAF